MCRLLAHDFHRTFIMTHLETKILVHVLGVICLQRKRENTCGEPLASALGAAVPHSRTTAATTTHYYHQRHIPQLAHARELQATSKDMLRSALLVVSEGGISVYRRNEVQSCIAWAMHPNQLDRFSCSCSNAARIVPSSCRSC